MSRDRATDILDVLSVTGGVPRYLEEVNPALPAARVANACKMGLSRGLSLPSSILTKVKSAFKYGNDISILLVMKRL